MGWDVHKQCLLHIVCFIDILLNSHFCWSIKFVLQFSNSPLYSASSEGHSAVLKTLIEAGANVNESNKVGDHMYHNMYIVRVQCTMYMSEHIC